MNQNRVLLIDGNNLIFRSYFAYSVERFTNNGVPVNAVYGFLAILISLLNQSNINKIVVAFDVSKKTFRKEIYPEYKEGRRKTDVELLDQIPKIYKMLEILGIKTVEKEGYEADDCLATLAKIETKKNNEVFIYSGDKDVFQLINNSTTVVLPKKGASNIEFINKEKLFKKFQLSPDQYRDYAAIVGESADNLKGAKGIGPKTATDLMLKYKSLDNIYKNIDEIKDSVKEKLLKSKDEVYMNKRINKLIDDLELDYDNADLNEITVEEFQHFFNELNFKTLPQRIIKSGVLKFKNGFVDDEMDFYKKELLGSQKGKKAEQTTKSAKNEQSKPLNNNLFDFTNND